MRTFLKVQAASILGSLADYLVTILLVELFNCWYLVANGIGNICGGCMQFILCRNWAFKSQGNKIPVQVFRFFIVFAGNLILSAAGIYFFTQYLRFNYLVSKTIVSVILGVSYNYILQKKFVFV